MNTIFAINGGAGRVICAIPALEKYARLNPDDDFKVVVSGWESLYWNHPVLQQRTFGMGHKRLFEDYIKKSKLVVPEPYSIHDYYNQKISMVEAFDREINNTTNHEDLTIPKLHLQKEESLFVKKIMDGAKKEKNLSKVIVFQPYGSAMNLNHGAPNDPTNRSMDPDQALYIAQKLSKHAIVVYFGPNELIHPRDNVMLNLGQMQTDLRLYLSFINEADYFVGCDSVGQHMARALDTPGLVVMGSTFEKNVSYPDYFKFYRKNQEPVYSPIRIAGIDCDFADRMNSGIMDFSTEQLDEIVAIIAKDINIDLTKSTKSDYSDSWNKMMRKEKV
jgi:hypothetical protein